MVVHRVLGAWKAMIEEEGYVMMKDGF